MSDEEDWPDELTLEGASFLIIAIRQGFDREGKMRYAMRHENGEPVRIMRAQYHRNSVGIAFNSPRGPVAFDFKMENE